MSPARHARNRGLTMLTLLDTTTPHAKPRLGALTQA
jgi:hypothetical protein